MNQKRIFTGLFVTFVIMLYILGSVSFALAESGSGRDGNGRDDEDSDDDDDDSDDSDDSLDDNSDDSGRDIFRTRERISVVGDDGVEREIEIRERARADGSFESRIKVRDVEIEVEDGLEIEESSDDNGPILRAKFSNGANAEIKIMPDTASASALEALRLHVCSEVNNCTIVLKDVGQREDDSDEIGDDTDNRRLRYEVRAVKKYRMFGIFARDVEVRAQISAADGSVIDTDRPWWAAVSSDSDDSADSTEDSADDSDNTAQ